MDTFYAKILLLGEYSVLSGSHALTTTYRKYSGELKLSSSSTDTRQQLSNSILSEFVSYLRTKSNSLSMLSVDFEKVEADLSAGLYFNSTIPQGYGLGSSGALVAAFVKKYARAEMEKIKLHDLRKILAEAESFFHSQSSGIDPITSYTSRSLLFRGDGVELIEEFADIRIRDSIYLYDSLLPSGTSDLVEIFQIKLRDKKFQNWYNSEYVGLVNATIEKMVNSGPEKIAEEIRSISDLQLNQFREMIPESVIPVWEKGLSTKAYSMKLCGSGGGGNFLVFSLLSVPELNSYFGNEMESI